ncbi:MAG: universal stress protein [Microcoleus sp. PH2017_29_MFU_D_A]|uniref:universal stress protein n=1 Tax=unclassified Microcoleus TaxID=2642155 RepID=UPI001DEF14AC|nr:MULTISPECIES: universal stress protein [unclassified Microcoleus]MCC3430910.1 universal stress protein [Microcoleus sp. PH2017_04_SCI_O_A]TAE53720.1 MAG: universal stress protein [Oscillatoriales cyanobacterium]MCC3423193.1 universal stress protein [Microcoleus sp. PH2017_01_SCD_O_A]MCC3601681.1 universal stress protein [Microcoleus sp. PH2017_29_MFU_D_A]MCC3632911.1 universal stress protein [Microcoleus sp. PH2017_37_MFU_D_B]
MLDTLLVAIDNSEFAAQVLQAVGQFKLEPTAKVILVHVVSSDTLDFDAVVDRPHAQGNEIAYREVEKLLQSYQEMLPCQSELEIVAGEPAEEILRLANIYKADLIAIGCRGLTGLKRILEGSVSAEVVAEAPCSVLVVRSR